MVHEEGRGLNTGSLFFKKKKVVNRGQRILQGGPEKKPGKGVGSGKNENTRT